MPSSPPPSPRKATLRPPSRTTSRVASALPRPGSSMSMNSDAARTASMSSRSTTPSLSAASTTSASTSSSARSRIGSGLVAPSTPSNKMMATPTTGKFKAALSIEARVKSKTSAGLLRPVSRPPSPRKPASSPGPVESPSRSPAVSPTRSVYTMNKDPEEGLVDWTNVEADMSGEFDQSFDGVGDETRDEEEIERQLLGEEEMVLVSVRVKPTSGHEKDAQAWNISQTENMIKLDPKHARSTAASSAKSQEYRFDALLTGSDNRTIYNRAARAHVRAAMEGYNSLVFAYGQTASGKTYTLMGSEDEPGIIPRALKDVFGYIRKTPSREFLLRASYLEIYNETVYDLLSSSVSGSVPPTITDAGVVNLREEVVTSLKGIREVIERGDRNRRTAATDWNERSSRSHSVFRLVIESREVSDGMESEDEDENGRATTPIPGYGRPVTPGGTRLQTKGGRGVQSSVLSLIDLAGSEKATSDKDRTREGKYINTSLLTLGTVISTLAENASRGKNDHVPYRNSKLTRLLQPSLSGNARVSVICTLNPSASAIAESTSTLGFASRIKKVHLHAVKKEIIDTDALIERYQKEIEELKSRLAEREREAQAPAKSRRLSVKQQHEESRALNDMSGRIKQLTKLILTSETINENKGDASRPASPSKLDFSQSPYELQKELLAAKEQMERQATLILSLEANLAQRAVVPLDAPEFEKDAKIIELQTQIKDLEFVTKRYEENLGEPLRAVKEDVEREWIGRVETLEEKVRMQASYAQECERALEKERVARRKLEEEKRALISFVADLDTSLPSLRSLGVTTPTATAFPSGSPFRPTLSALSETDTNTPPRGFPSSEKTASGKQRVSSLTLRSRTVPMRATLLDQVAPEDVPIPDTDTEDKEN